MTARELIDTARLLMGSGMLAMDESNGACDRRFVDAGIQQTEEARRAYRELIVTTPGLEDSISGAILYDETIRQRTKDGTPFFKVLTEAGIIPGILEGMILKPHMVLSGLSCRKQESGSCPSAWCRSAGSVEVSGGAGRLCQAAAAGSVTKGSSP